MTELSAVTVRSACCVTLSLWSLSSQVPKPTGEPYKWQRPSVNLHWMDDNDSEEPESHPVLPATTGPEHWEAQRHKWTKGFSKYKIPAQNKDIYGIQLAQYERLVQFYKQIQKSTRPLRRPIRLTHLIRILVAGWKADGIWPSEESLRVQILQKGLRPEKYNLSVHLASILDSGGEKDEKGSDVELT